MPISTVSSTSLAFAIVLAHRREHLVGHRDVERHGVGERERGALGRAEQLRLVPLRQRRALLDRDAVGEGELRHMLVEHVVDAVEMGDADDDDLAQPAAQPRLPAHGADMIEPGFGERRAVQEELVDVEERARAAGANLGDQRGEFGMRVGFDQGNPGHGSIQTGRGVGEDDTD